MLKVFSLHHNRSHVFQCRDLFDVVENVCTTFHDPKFLALMTVCYSIVYLGPQYARFSPKLYYWIFIPCDILSLVIQSVGGSLSSVSSGSSRTAVDIAIAGLSFQVFTLLVFIALAAEYGYRYWKAEGSTAQLPTKFKVFVIFLSAAIILILIRCAYRIDELSDGYNGPLIHDQGLFISLEGVYVVDPLRTSL